MDKEIIKDLLPGYIDGITSSATNEAVANALANDPELQQYYQEMKQSMAFDQTRELKQIDPLKRIKKINRRRVLLGILGTALLLVGLYFGSAFYARSYEAATDDVTQTSTAAGNIIGFNFATKSQDDHIYTMALTDEDNDLADGYQVVTTVKQARTLPWDKPLRKTGDVSFTFIDADIIYLSNGSQRKLTDADTLTIKYQDRTEVIKIKDLYQK